MNGRIPRHKVAEAIIVSIDPTKSVGRVELGNEFVEITIESAETFISIASSIFWDACFEGC